jgi:ribonuclease HII
VTQAFRIGADENGLGARLGPLIVTAVLARVDETGARTLARRLRGRIAEDLDDSKRLVAHGNIALGEAWARAIGGRDAKSPAELFRRISLEGEAKLREPCPDHVGHQCWSAEGEGFTAPDELLARVEKHVGTLSRRGVQLLAVRSSVSCTHRLNTEKEQGHNRFVADLHAMERLVIDLRDRAGSDVIAVCGKVGGIGDYSRFFGPLSNRLHAVVEQGRKRSAYRFPGLGEVAFVQDADAQDPLVMLASLVGKWVRELLMDRIVRFYEDGADTSPSGYNDPVTARFVAATALSRKRRRVPDGCFERTRDRDD